MKKSTVLISLSVAVLFGFLTVGTVYADPPDMSQWVGKWFSVKLTLKRTAFNTSDSKFYQDPGGGPRYMKIWNWDPIKQEFQIDFCEFDTDIDNWSVNNLRFLFLAGTNDKFLWSGGGCAEDGEKERGLLVAVMEGSKKNGVLKGANIKTLGGAAVNMDNGNISAGSSNLSGKMIDSSKIPVACIVIH